MPLGYLNYAWQLICNHLHFTSTLTLTDSTPNVSGLPEDHHAGAATRSAIRLAAVPQDGVSPRLPSHREPRLPWRYHLNSLCPTAGPRALEWKGFDHNPPVWPSACLTHLWEYYGLKHEGWFSCVKTEKACPGYNTTKYRVKSNSENCQ